MLCRLVSMLTNGVVNYLQKKWLSREFQDRSFTEADSIGVTIGHVQGLLIVLSLSVAFATAIMLIELAVYRSGSKTWSWFHKRRQTQTETVKKPRFPRFYQWPRYTINIHKFIKYCVWVCVCVRVSIVEPNSSIVALIKIIWNGGDRWSIKVVER